MTERTNTMRRLRAPLMAAGVVLTLSGCAATHVGENWQCPLAQGSQCTSVAAADPAVKDANGPERPARPAPLHLARDEGDSLGVSATEPDIPVDASRRDCVARCNPFAWVARLFDAEDQAEDEDSPHDIGDAAVADGPDDTPDRMVADGADPAPEGLRAPETIGRIWIAPHVDAAGVYREASWVRIVIAPADWKPH